MRQSDKKPKSKKRKIIDDKLLENEKTLVTNIEELPRKEYDTTEYVEPYDNSVDLNRDSSILFEIKSSDHEYFYFNRDFQAVLEMSIYQQNYNADDTKKDVTLVYKQAKPAATQAAPNPEDPNTFAFAPSSSGLSIFKNISVSYMNHTKDESLTFPQEGCFLNSLTAQDFLFTGSRVFEKIQNQLNNYSITNDVRLGDNQEYIPQRIQRMRYAKIHTSLTDAPEIEGVDKNDLPTALNGKMHYLYIPRTPFVANNTYLQNRYRLQSMIVFPPNSTVRIVFHKNDIALKYLSINKEIDIIAQSKNRQIATTSWQNKDIQYHIHNMHLVIHRVKLDPKLPSPTKFVSNITVNHFDLMELTTATTQKIQINWRSKETPTYIVLSFMRQQDVIFNELDGLPQAINQFFLPEYLSSITVRRQDYINEVFDGLKIENLDKQDYHPSKAQYIEYLKKHTFVPHTFKFTDLFSVDSTITTGACNVFPIDLVGRDIQADPQNRGLEVELNYSRSNTKKWFLAPRFVYIGNQIMTRQADKQYKVEFNYY